MILVILIFSFVGKISGFLDPVVLCENAASHLRCPPGEVIEIIYSYYGRGSDPNVCAAQNRNGLIQQNCYHENPHDVLKCNGKNVCHVHATNTWFGDPCFGSVKHLFIQYDCMPKEIMEKINAEAQISKDEKTALLCESTKKEISCPAGKKIDVHYTFYGRGNDPSVCFHRLSKGSNCYFENLKNINCQGKQKCMLEATNALFGDPCVGTLKYLLVDYSCK